MKLVFATNNKHKREEIRNILKHTNIEILCLKDIGITGDIPETSETLEGNALQKARYIFEKHHFNCFADDTGLEVDCLDGAPGVFSARYAGEACSFDDNINKLLKEMEGKKNRKACFKTVIALITDGKETLFYGKVFGEILYERKGIMGFGYDPVFQPDGCEKSFAEMLPEEKNSLSHRYHAIAGLKKFLLKKI
jgi:XTP/dITP diphosphohydrolase